MSTILLMNDFVSTGKLSGNMMDSVLSYMGHKVYFLPTALISNNFSKGSVALSSTSNYLSESLGVYEKLGIDFDIIFIGYVEDSEQAELIKTYIKKIDKKPLVVLDPIMGDNGKLYKGLGQEKINIYKSLLEISDIIIPNLTEAKFLGLRDYEKLKGDSKKYLISGLEDENGYYNLAIDKEINKIYTNRVDGQFKGTGDLLDALFLSFYLERKDMALASKKASQTISEILKKAKLDEEMDGFIIIEKYLTMIKGASHASWFSLL